MPCLLKLLYVCCSFLLVVAATAPNFAAQVKTIPMLSGLNFKSCKESTEIVLRCMDLDLSLRENRLVEIVLIKPDLSPKVILKRKALIIKRLSLRFLRKTLLGS